ncbi:MAG: toxin [Calditrichia bacterium]|nr:toxin [Calditrichia bacterium]
MKLINWNREKNEWLRKNRGICFEDILFYLDNNYLIDDVKHPNQVKFSGQRMMVFNIVEYIHLILYVESEDEIFLKTIIPSRKATKNYLEKNDE